MIVTREVAVSVVTLPTEETVVEVEVEVAVAVFTGNTVIGGFE